ncbi:unnamed protein product [Rotaria sp. Silwood1]|nr:unnamed protein product [Rotaria sp. Silwood1]
MLDHLSPSIEQLKLKSKSILSDWQEYNRVLLQIEKIIREPEAGIDRLQTSAINVETYEISTRKIQEHLQIMELHRHVLDQIVSQDRQLSSQCDGQTSLKINQITHRIQQQWTNVEQRLQEIIRPSREIVDNWRQFNSSYLHLLDRLGELEARWYTIQREIFTSDIESLLDKTKDFQQRLQQLDNEITRLYERAQKLANHLPAIVAKKIDTQYSIIKNQYLELCTFHDILQSDCNELKQREKIYLDYLNELIQIINQIQIDYKSQQLTDENEINNLKQLHEFHTLLLSKHDLIEPIELNLAIIQLYLHTNYQGLLEIDINLTNIINDFNQRQQELIQLINEGKQLIEQNLIIDQHTFTKLEQRWQLIIKTILNKQQDIKNIIKLWLSYQNYLENYYRLLKNKYEFEQEQLRSPTINLINQIKQGTYLNSL